MILLEVLFDFWMPLGLPNWIESGLGCSWGCDLSHTVERRAGRKREAKLLHESEAAGVGAE